MRFKALRHQPSDAARKSGYDNEGQLPDTLPDSRSRPKAVAVLRIHGPVDCFWPEADIEGTTVLSKFDAVVSTSSVA